GFAGGVLPSGAYRATLAADKVQNAAGKGLAADSTDYFLWVHTPESGSNLEMRRSSLASTANVEVYDLSVSSTTPAYVAAASTLNQFSIGGGSGDDVVEFDLSNGGAGSSSTQVAFDLGGQQSGDRLTVSGGS